MIFSSQIHFYCAQQWPIAPNILRPLSIHGFRIYYWIIMPLTKIILLLTKSRQLAASCSNNINYYWSITACCHRRDYTSTDQTHKTPSPGIEPPSHINEIQYDDPLISFAYQIWSKVWNMFFLESSVYSWFLIPRRGVVCSVMRCNVDNRNYDYCWAL